MEEEKKSANRNETGTDVPESDIRELLKKNLELTEEIFMMTKKIKNFVFWERILSIVKVLLIVVPLVIGIIYLPALLENVIAPYRELLGSSPFSTDSQDGSASTIDLNSINLNNLPDSVKKYLK